MNNTEHFNLLTYGPDDIVNVMTVDKSNMETIDAALQKNLIQGISKATELKTDTVHALTRFDEDCPIFRFTSTTNFVAGETFVVDGQQVTALTPAGSSLATGAYVIGSEVLCILRDTRLTIFVSGASTADDALKLGGELPEFYAKQEDMDSVTATANAAGSLAQSNLAKINDMNGRLTQVIGMPDYKNAKAISGNSYTVAENGYIFGTGTFEEQFARKVYVNGTLVGLYGANSTYGWLNTILTPVSVGDVVTSDYGFYKAYFVPFKA